MGWLDSLDTTLAIATIATATNSTRSSCHCRRRNLRPATRCTPNQHAVTSFPGHHPRNPQGREIAMAASISTTRSSAPRAPTTARVTRRELVGSGLRRRAERIRGTLVVLALLLPLLITVLMGGR
jgi:hypothetical protein